MQAPPGDLVEAARHPASEPALRGFVGKIDQKGRPRVVHDGGLSALGLRSVHWLRLGWRPEFWNVDELLPSLCNHPAPFEEAPHGAPRFADIILPHAHLGIVSHGVSVCAAAVVATLVTGREQHGTHARARRSHLAPSVARVTPRQQRRTMLCLTVAGAAPTMSFAHGSSRAPCRPRLRSKEERL